MLGCAVSDESASLWLLLGKSVASLDPAIQLYPLPKTWSNAHSAFVADVGPNQRGLIVVGPGKLFEDRFLRSAYPPQAKALFTEFAPKPGYESESELVSLGDFGGDGHEDLWVTLMDDHGDKYYRLYRGTSGRFNPGQWAAEFPSARTGASVYPF